MRISLCIFIFTVLISTSIQASTPKQEYVVKKDMITIHKAAQFSIYSDQAEKYLKYRIESYYSPMQKIDLRTYPEKNIIAKLDASHLAPWYEARFELLNTRNTTNKWFTGSIKRNSVWFKTYTINLAERTILIKTKIFSSKFRFFNEAGKLLALFKRRLFVLSGATIYDLKIFSDEFPDSVYMLAIAAHNN